MSTILSVAMYFIRTYISRSGWKEEGAEDKGKRKNLPHKSQHKIVPIALRSLFVFPASLLSLSLSHRLGKWKIALMEKACQRGEAHVAFYIQWKLRGWIFIIDFFFFLLWFRKSQFSAWQFPFSLLSSTSARHASEWCLAFIAPVFYAMGKPQESKGGEPESVRP